MVAGSSKRPSESVQVWKLWPRHRHFAPPKTLNLAVLPTVTHLPLLGLVRASPRQHPRTLTFPELWVGVAVGSGMQRGGNRGRFPIGYHSFLLRRALLPLLAHDRLSNAISRLTLPSLSVFQYPPPRPVSKGARVKVMTG